MKSFFIKRILIPVDFSFTALKAVDHAVNIAKLAQAEIYLLHVIENIHSTTDPLYFSIPREGSLDEELTRISNVSLNRIANKIKSKGLTNIHTLTVFGRTHKEIIKTAKKIKADLIVMGTHGVTGFQEFIMGSNTYRVVSDAECPVLSVQRKNKAVGYKNILVPFTDSIHSREKVSFAIRVAELFGSKISILGFDTGDTKAHSKKIALQAEQIKKVVEKHKLNNTIKIVQLPYTAKTLLDYSKKINADLITVTGNVDKRDITEYFKGSLSQQLINHSELPVLSIHKNVNPKTIALWTFIE
jgi:nucleotide-binding universal stress UspA family protein